MSRSVHVVWDEALAAYDFGDGHPLAPVRVELTIALARALGVLDGDPVRVVPPLTVDDSALAPLHHPDYVAAVRRAGSPPYAADPAFGLGSTDNPVFPGMHEASRQVVGASLAAAQAVWEGGADHGVNVAGGLHHAMADRAAGFCIYNDPALAIRWLLDQGARRVAYVDVDVHHGDGVQAAFWDEPRVLTVSIHESGRYLFPGTGFPEETGGPAAPGSAVNVALPPGTDDRGWLRAFHAVVPPLLQRFAPDVLVSQHGCDSHATDPLAHLALSVDAQRRAHADLHRLAHEVAGGRWVALGGGGYQAVQVVPRSWTHLLAEAAGRPLDPATETPPPWRELARARTGQQPPATLTDGATPHVHRFDGFFCNPADAVDAAILATMQASFPHHGLDPSGMT